MLKVASWLRCSEKLRNSRTRCGVLKRISESGLPITVTSPFPAISLPHSAGQSKKWTRPGPSYLDLSRSGTIHLWTHMTGYKRGDVVLAIFPNSDRQTFKKRPVLVVQNESVQTHFGQTIVAPITSNLGRVSPAMLPVKVGSPEHKSMGLLSDSVINLRSEERRVGKECRAPRSPHH